MRDLVCDAANEFPGLHRTTEPALGRANGPNPGVLRCARDDIVAKGQLALS